MEKEKNKIMRTINKALMRNNIIDTESIDEIESVISRVLVNRSDAINNIKTNSLSKTLKKYDKKYVENVNSEVVNTDDAINLAMLIHTVLSEYLADNIDWWIETALEQYRQIATSEVNKIVDTILVAYSSKRYLTEDDVKNATYRSFFRNTPKNRVEMLIPKDLAFVKDLVEVIKDYKERNKD